MVSYRKRLALATATVLASLGVGTGGFYVLEGGQASLIDCAYMTVTTVSTVGYEEVFPIDTAGAKLFTMGLIVFGMGSLLYFVTTAAAFVIEGELRSLLRRKRMERKMNALRGHTIICGAGKSGFQVAQELIASGGTVVAIDTDRELLDRAEEALGKHLYTFHGDAASDEALQTAAVGNAAGLVVALSDDRDNLFVTFSARQLNPNLRIISRSSGPDEGRKLVRAGANAVVSPNVIAAHRMVSELVHPQVTGFVDSMLLDQGPLRITEVVIDEGSKLAGKHLGDGTIRKRSNALVVAAKDQGDGAFRYNPGPDLVFTPGLLLIVLGPKDAVSTFVGMARG